MTRQELTDFIIDALRREQMEAKRLERIEHDHDFTPLVRSIIDDLTSLADRFNTMLQEVAPPLSETEVTETVTVLLGDLPSHYPPATFTKTATGYWLDIDHTIIFRDASGEDAIKHTQNYVDARRDSPNLPIGVIYGIYD